MHRGHQEAQILGQLLAHPLDPRQQLAALVAVHQRNQAIAHFQADHVDGRHVIPAKLLGFLGAGRRRQQLLLALDLLQGVNLGDVLLLPEQVSATGRQGRHAQEREVRHAGHQAHDRHQTGCHRQRLGRGEHLAIDLLAHVFRTGRTGHHDCRCCR
ncbi:hypothetical protein D3C85_753350 [compost metagenome]